MTHEHLRKRAIKWLTNTQHCGVVLSEIHSINCLEIPDAIGWRGPKSILIEVKTSRADYLRNKDKASVRTSSQIGLMRFFMIPDTEAIVGPDGTMKREKHIITSADLEGSPYGLLMVEKNIVRVAKQAIPCPERNQEHEIGLLVSALRRVKAREFLVIVPESEVCNDIEDTGFKIPFSETPENPITDAKIGGWRIRKEMIDQSGGLLTAEEVAAILDISPQMVELWGAEKQLLVIAGRYPAFQFQARKPLDIGRVLSKLKHLDQWMQLRFFTTPHERLGDLTPIVALQNFRVEDVIAVASGYGEQGAM